MRVGVAAWGGQVQADEAVATRNRRKAKSPLLAKRAFLFEPVHAGPLPSSGRLDRLRVVSSDLSPLLSRVRYFWSEPYTRPDRLR